MKSVLITGATSGIGNHLIKILANSDYKIYFIGRNKEKCERLVKELKNKYNYEAEYFLCDFSNLSSVNSACNKIVKSLKKIDVLVNNAGKVYFSYGKTHDNFERCFQINYLSHFLLTETLIENKLIRENCQIINVSSVAHNPKSSINSLDGIKNKELIGKINFEDINYEKEKFRGFSGMFYSRSKMAQIMWTYHLSKKHKDIFVNAIHPGLLGSNVINESGFLGKLITPLFKLFFRSSKEGAENIIYVMNKVFEENISGKYFSEKEESKSFEKTYDIEDQKELYELSQNLINKFS